MPRVEIPITLDDMEELVKEIADYGYSLRKRCEEIIEAVEGMEADIAQLRRCAKAFHKRTPRPPSEQ